MAEEILMGIANKIKEIIPEAEITEAGEKVLITAEHEIGIKGISITIECEDLTIESKEHQFHQLVERAITFGFSKSHDREAMCVNFVFPSVWDKSM